MTPTMTPPPQVQRQLATRTHGTRIALIVVFILGSAIGGAVWLFVTRGPTTPKATMTSGTRPWTRS